MAQFLKTPFAFKNTRTLSGVHSWVRGAVFCLATCSSIVLLTLSAKINVPFYPVPMTLQVLALMTIGCFLPRAVAISALTGYIGLGALGLPVFALTPQLGVGIPYLMGPTGGYIFGFLPAIFIFASITSRHAWWQSALRLLAGVAVIYACGLLQLGALIGWQKPLFALGLLPFIGGDIAKTLIVWVCLLADRGGIIRKVSRAW